MKEFADHPVTIGSYPGSYGKVMAKLTHVLPGAPGYDNGNDQCRKDHGNSKRLPDHAPGYIFKQPEYDMQVFHFPVT